MINLENVPKLSEIIIEIRNGDNSPLKINEVTGNYVPDRIVFRATEGEDYKITFGDENLNKPEYDIVEFADSIKERDEVFVGKLEKADIKKVSKPRDYTVYYNVFIGVVVVILIGFMVNKINTIFIIHSPLLFFIFAYFPYRKSNQDYYDKSYKNIIINCVIF